MDTLLLPYAEIYVTVISVASTSDFRDVKKIFSVSNQAKNNNYNNCLLRHAGSTQNTCTKTLKRLKVLNTKTKILRLR